MVRRRAVLAPPLIALNLHEALDGRVILLPADVAHPVAAALSGRPRFPSHISTADHAGGGCFELGLLWKCGKKAPREGSSLPGTGFFRAQPSTPTRTRRRRLDHQRLQGHAACCGRWLRRGEKVNSQRRMKEVGTGEEDRGRSKHRHLVVVEWLIQQRRQRTALL